MAMFVDRHAVTSEKQADAPSRDVGGVAWQKCRLFCDMSLLYTKLSASDGQSSDGRAVETNIGVEPRCKHP
jgi:hypothetical protein